MDDHTPPLDDYVISVDSGLFVITRQYDELTGDVLFDVSIDADADLYGTDDVDAMCDDIKAIAAYLERCASGEQEQPNV